MKTINPTLILALILITASFPLPTALKGEEPQTLEDLQNELKQLTDGFSEKKLKMEAEINALSEAEKKAKEEEKKKTKEQLQEKIEGLKKDLNSANSQFEEIKAQERPTFEKIRAIEEQSSKEKAENIVQLKNFPMGIDRSGLQSRLNSILNRYSQKEVAVYSSGGCLEYEWRPSNGGFNSAFRPSGCYGAFSCTDDHGASHSQECTRRAPDKYEGQRTVTRKLSAIPDSAKVHAICDPKTKEVLGYKLRHQVRWRRFLIFHADHWVDLYYSADGKFLGSIEDKALSDWL